MVSWSEIVTTRLSFLVDANQCMRVSSALEAGTVSDPVATVRDARTLMVIAGFPFLSHVGLGEPVQHHTQQRPVRGQETERNRYGIYSTSSLALYVLTSDGIEKGRELGKQGLDEYISVKAVHWNFGDKGSWPL